MLFADPLEDDTPRRLCKPLEVVIAEAVVVSWVSSVASALVDHFSAWVVVGGACSGVIVARLSGAAGVVEVGFDSGCVKTVSMGTVVDDAVSNVGEVVGGKGKVFSYVEEGG